MTSRQTVCTKRSGSRASVLVIVLWICFGLVALVIYFANSMSAELRAADNRAAESAAREALAGAERYAAYVLTQYATNGTLPVSTDYKSEAVPVGDAYFWFIGRDPNQQPTSEPIFGLVDEASKLNINTATRSMLEALPGMTSDLAASIVDWRSSSSDSSAGGAKDEVYARLDPPRRCKSSRFETIDELRLVYGATLEILLGEDTNRNGTLDPNEDDSTQTAPRDDQNGLLQPGILEYVTVYSSQPNTKSDGSQKLNLTDNSPRVRGQLFQLLQTNLQAQRASAIMAAIGPRDIRSVAEFIVLGSLTDEEFTKIRNDVTASTGSTVSGLINVNTASAAVLACLPGMTTDRANSMVAYRLAHASSIGSMAWITQVLDNSTVIGIGRYITDQSYQFTADIAAVGKNGRGYCREKVVFEMSKGTPRIVYRQDLSAYGWALGAQTLQTLKEKQGNRL